MICLQNSVFHPSDSEGWITLIEKSFQNIDPTLTKLIGNTHLVGEMISESGDGALIIHKAHKVKALVHCLIESQYLVIQLVKLMI